MTLIKKALKKSAFCQGLSDHQLNSLIPFIRQVTLDKQESLFREGDYGKSLFLITKGSVEILKKDSSSKHDSCLAVLHKGDVLGEMAPLGTAHRTTSARAVKKTHLLELSFEELSHSHSMQKVYFHIKSKIPQILTLRVISNNNTLVDAFGKQLEHEKARSALGDFIVHLNILLFLYTFALKIIAILQVKTISTTIISTPVLLIFAIAMLRMMKQSGYPWKMYGFTLKGWKKSLILSFFLSLPLFAAVTLYKWIMIQIDPALHHLSVFRITAALSSNIQEPVSYPMIALLILGYIIFVPVQEMIYRGAMQTTLEQFLIGKHKTLTAILISNLPFSFIHLHVSLILTILVYFFGVVWGWLYAKQRTLVGCTLSHFFVGIWAFFIIGIEDVFQM